MSNDQIVIIIVNYITYNDTINTVKSLEQIDYPNYDIVIVDNASPNNSYNVLKKVFGSKYHVIKTEKNILYSGGINYGIKYYLKYYGEPKYFIIMNNDVEIGNKNIVYELLRLMENNKEIGIIAPKIIEKYGEKHLLNNLSITFFIFNNLLYPISYLFRIIKEKYFLKSVQEVPAVSGAFFMLRAEDVIRVNFFDETPYLYFEEYIISKKMKDINKKTCYIKSLSIFHFGEKTINKTMKFTKKYNYYIKSLEYFLYHYRNYSKRKIKFVKFTYKIFLFYLKIIIFIKRKRI